MITNYIIDKVLECNMTEFKELVYILFLCGFTVILDFILSPIELIMYFIIKAKNNKIPYENEEQKPIKYTATALFPNKEIMEDALKHMRGK